MTSHRATWILGALSVAAAACGSDEDDLARHRAEVLETTRFTLEHTSPPPEADYETPDRQVVMSDGAGEGGEFIEGIEEGLDDLGGAWTLAPIVGGVGGSVFRGGVGGGVFPDGGVASGWDTARLGPICRLVQAFCELAECDSGRSLGCEALPPLCAAHLGAMEAALDPRVGIMLDCISTELVRLGCTGEGFDDEVYVPVIVSCIGTVIESETTYDSASVSALEVSPPVGVPE